MSIIYENEILNKKMETINLSDKLIDSAKEFSSYVAEINEVIEALKVYLNTTGGVEKIKQLENLDFNTIFLSSIADKSSNVSINYEKKRYDID